MLDKTLTIITEMPLNMRLWTVDEYYRMANAGILQSDERVELIAGQVIDLLDDRTEPEPDLAVVMGDVIMTVIRDQMKYIRSSR